MVDEKVKICVICHIEIHTRDSYVHLIDYKSGKFEKEAHYHRVCFHERLSNMVQINKESLIKQANEIAQQIIRTGDY